MFIITALSNLRKAVVDFSHSTPIAIIDASLDFWNKDHTINQKIVSTYDQKDKFFCIIFSLTKHPEEHGKVYEVTQEEYWRIEDAMDAGAAIRRTIKSSESIQLSNMVPKLLLTEKDVQHVIQSYDQTLINSTRAFCNGWDAALMFQEYKDTHPNNEVIFDFPAWQSAPFLGRKVS